MFMIDFHGLAPLGSLEQSDGRCNLSESSILRSAADAARVRGKKIRLPNHVLGRWGPSSYVRGTPRGVVYGLEVDRGRDTRHSQVSAQASRLGFDVLSSCCVVILFASRSPLQECSLVDPLHSFVG